MTQGALPEFFKTFSNGVAWFRTDRVEPHGVKKSPTGHNPTTLLKIVGVWHRGFHLTFIHMYYLKGGQFEW